MSFSSVVNISLNNSHPEQSSTSRTESRAKSPLWRYSMTASNTEKQHPRNPFISLALDWELLTWTTIMEYKWTNSASALIPKCFLTKVWQLYKHAETAIDYKYFRICFLVSSFSCFTIQITPSIDRLPQEPASSIASSNIPKSLQVSIILPRPLLTPTSLHCQLPHALDFSELWTFYSYPHVFPSFSHIETTNPNNIIF